MTKAKIGMLGAGFWALENHLPALKSCPEVEVVGICRLGAAEVRTAQVIYSIPFATENYEELIALKDLDGVVIASPHNLHFEHASAALARGLHVMCEKPMTLKASEAKQLSELARSRKLHFLIPYGWNYTEYAASARKFVTAGAIGEVEHVLCHMASSLRDLFSGRSVSWADQALFKPQSETWSNPSVGGGFAHGQLTHALALLLWVANLVPAEVFALSRSSETGADLYDAISCRFTNGATGMLGGAGTMPRGSVYQVDIRLFGSEGMLLLDIERPRLELRRNDGRHEVIPITDAPGAYTCVRPVHRFVDLILGKAVENCSTASLGANVVGILDAACRSASSGKVENAES
jgi:predicted dehydrogenase